MGVTASYWLSIKSEVDLNVSHQLQLSKSTFRSQSIQNIPFKYHQQVSQRWSRGTFQTDLTVLFLTPSDPTQPITGTRLSRKSVAAADPSQQLF